MDVTPGAFGVREAAAYSSLSEREINYAISAGDLPVKGGGQKGGKRLILRGDLDDYLAGLPDYQPRGA